jgi:uncharacterized membrane protein YgaE (UPF0421/DUF939 family)
MNKYLLSNYLAYIISGYFIGFLFIYYLFKLDVTISFLAGVFGAIIGIYEVSIQDKLRKDVIEENETYIEKIKKLEQTIKEIDKQKSSEETIKILKSRYAKGEVTKEQFEQMKKDLDD